MKKYVTVLMALLLVVGISSVYAINFNYDEMHRALNEAITAKVQTILNTTIPADKIDFTQDDALSLPKDLKGIFVENLLKRIDAITTPEEVTDMINKLVEGREEDIEKWNNFLDEVLADRELAQLGAELIDMMKARNPKVEMTLKELVDSTL